jgi:hypothetical protein
MPSATRKLKVLFLCTGNSCRSQMAEGWAHALKGDVIEAYSAGIETHGMNPNAIKVMAEAGVDITGQHSKKADELKRSVRCGGHGVRSRERNLSGVAGLKSARSPCRVRRSAQAGQDGEDRRRSARPLPPRA